MASETVKQRFLVHGTQGFPISHIALPPATSSSMGQPRDVLDPVPSIGITSNPLTMDTGNFIQGVVGPTEESAIRLAQLNSRTDQTRTDQEGATPLLTRGAQVTHPSASTFPMMPFGSSSYATVFPSTVGSPNGSGSQPNIFQAPNPRAHYVAPSKGPMLGGIEVTIIGTNFPHELPVYVYFGTRPAIIVSKERIVCAQFINAERATDSKDGGDHTMHRSPHIVSGDCRCENCGRTPRISTGY